MRVEMTLQWMMPLMYFLLLLISTASGAAALRDDEEDRFRDCWGLTDCQSPLRKLRQVKASENQDVLSTPDDQRFDPGAAPSFALNLTVAEALRELEIALEVMQREFFALWVGKWTTAIDWTAAVMNTHISAALSTFSRALSSAASSSDDRTETPHDAESKRLENEINKYFSVVTAYYFGEEAFSIRNEAYDDILWVVLGWLESIQFINAHTQRQHPPRTSANGEHEWYAQQFIPTFAHRARVFYELAEQGWDWRLCGGGMTWNPRFLPYKNAVTNELFISASVSMYLHFPGDSNCSPFMRGQAAQDPPHNLNAEAPVCSDSHPSTYDKHYLTNAINGYDWLADSGMKNAQGLYTDGFHIKDYAQNHSNTECNERNEMLYTYNQGVILSGLRGLWEATGNTTYLDDGYTLVRNVIRATGFDLDSQMTNEEKGETSIDSNFPYVVHQKLFARRGKWAGLGSTGILTELCDPSGTCSQDGQTFKGIFFHHMTKFCERLPTVAVKPGKTHAASEGVADSHREKCHEYMPWVRYNAYAALYTRDRKGRFGSWWGAGRATWDGQENEMPADVKDALDYRNDAALLSGFFKDPERNGRYDEEKRGEEKCDETTRKCCGDASHESNLNDRGRGRTVETQGGGVAVVRALWEFLNMQEEDGMY